MLPTGKAGTNYIDEITRLLNSWIDNTALSTTAFKAIMIMPILLLQKPSKKSKAKDDLKALKRRLDLWHEGNVMELFRECETIQNLLTSSNHIDAKTTMSTTPREATSKQ